MFKLLALDPNFLILFLNVDDHLDKFPLLFLHLWSLFSKLFVVGFDLSNRLLDLVETLLVPLLDLDHVLLALLQEPCEDAERAHEENRCYVDDMAEFIVIDLAQFN